MKTRIQKWGNSLALRIPQAFAVEAGLAENRAVEMTLVKGRLVIQPAANDPPTLEELLRGVTDENLHGEWDTGPAVGREIW
jgi:antitoxin MazE